MRSFVCLHHSAAQKLPRHCVGWCHYEIEVGFFFSVMRSELSPDSASASLCDHLSLWTFGSPPPSVGEILDAANWAVNPHPGESSGEFHPAELTPWVLSVAHIGQLWPVLVCAV